jgi:hypothetical protein
MHITDKGSSTLTQQQFHMVADKERGIAVIPALKHPGKCTCFRVDGLI